MINERKNLICIASLLLFSPVVTEIAHANLENHIEVEFGEDLIIGLSLIHI